MTDANPDCAFVEKRIYLVAQRMGEACPSDFCSDDHKIDVKNSAVPEPDIEHGMEYICTYITSIHYGPL